MNPEELLAHADFVRALSRRLVRDENTADDVAQETWLAALKTRSAAPRSTAAWLTRLAANFARRIRRGEGRRALRERKGASPEKVPSAAEVAEQEEIRRRVVAAVLALDEPYRSAILLRFYRDLPPREVARSLGVPVETARSRIRRGLEQLRARLDAAHGRDGASWIAALAPIAGLEIVSPAAAAPAVLPALVKGVLLMSPKIKVGIAAAAVFFTVLAAWHILFVQADGGRPGAPAGLEDTASAALAGAPQADPSAASGPKAAEPAREPIAMRETGPFISGRVIDKATREPVKAFHVQIPNARDGRSAFEKAVNATIQDEDGRFRFDLIRGGRYSVRVRSSTHVAYLSGVDVPHASGISGLCIELDPGFAAAGRVVDDETGEPIAGALVGPSPGNEEYLYWQLAGFDEYVVAARTDADGLFRLQGLDDYGTGRCVIGAEHPDYARAGISVRTAGSEQVEIRLRKGHRIFGRVFDDSGQPAADVIVCICGNEMQVGRPVLTEPDGSYRAPPALPGPVSIHAVASPFASDPAVSFAEEWKSVEMVDRDVEVNFGIPEDYVTLKGTLLDDAGGPVPRGRIELHLDTQEDPSPVRHAQAKYRTATCDDEGRFEIKKLAVGTYGVKVGIPDAMTFDWGPLALHEPGEVVRDIRIPAVQLRGRVVDSATGGTPVFESGRVFLWPVGERNRRYSFFPINEQGRFEIVGLPPGEYTLDVYVEGYPQHFDTLMVATQAEPDELVVPLQPGGELKLALTGFSRQDTSVFYDVAVTMQNGEALTTPISSGDWQDGRAERVISLEPGRGKAEIWLGTGESIAGDFEIRTGETTVLELRRCDALQTRKIDVQGKVTFWNGEPVAGAEVRFSPQVALQPQDGAAKIVTDSKGKYHAAGLSPGEWEILVTRDKSITTYFSLRLSDDGQALVDRDLNMPAGVVKGTAFDAWTDLPVNDQRLSAAAVDEGARRLVATWHAPANGPQLCVAGLPPVRLSVSISATGYKSYRSEPFIMPEGGTVDLGRIPLQPNGKLDLEVVDPEGRAVAAYTVEWLDDRIAPDGPMFEATGRYVYEGLPHGTVPFRVAAKGFKPQEATAAITPRGSSRLRLVLERE